MSADGVKKTTIPKVPLSEQLNKGESSLIKRYQEKTVGEDGYLALLEYELANVMFGNLPGALGYFFRKITYRRLLKNAGAGVIFGRGVVIRHPKRITLGHRVAIDDYTMLDASGAGNEGMVLEDDVIISRNCVIQSKTGPVRVGQRTNIGVNVVITSSLGVTLGHSVLIGGNCYLGGGQYHSQQLDVPFMDQGVYSKGPVKIGDGTWLGAGVIVLDGVCIGKNCIISAGAVVTKDLPDYVVAVGVPAAIREYRKDGGKV